MGVRWELAVTVYIVPINRVLSPTGSEPLSKPRVSRSRACLQLGSFGAYVLVGLTKLTKSHVPILLPPHLTHPQVLGRQVCTTLGLFRVKVSTLGLMHDR
jgi:hypothetical protein